MSAGGYDQAPGVSGDLYTHPESDAPSASDLVCVQCGFDCRCWRSDPATYMPPQETPND